MSEELNLIVGLGNPGEKYERTRHNAGFDILDELSDVTDINITKKKLGSLFGLGFIKKHRVILAKPMSFMNLSGQPLKDLIEYFNIDFDNLIVIHDDIDLEFGRIKIKQNGGHGGHNGLKSIMNYLKTDKFARIRFGIRRPSEFEEVANYVLKRYNDYEKDKTIDFFKLASDAVISIVSDGMHKSMNYFNRKKFLV
jgi:PTH1 family peptidyl-tRNA hydrolase